MDDSLGTWREKLWERSFLASRVAPSPWSVGGQEAKVYSRRRRTLARWGPGAASGAAAPPGSRSGRAPLRPPPSGLRNRGPAAAPFRPAGLTQDSVAQQEAGASVFCCASSLTRAGGGQGRSGGRRTGSPQCVRSQDAPSPDPPLALHRTVEGPGLWSSAGKARRVGNR